MERVEMRAPVPYGLLPTAVGVLKAGRSKVVRQYFTCETTFLGGFPNLNPSRLIAIQTLLFALSFLSPAVAESIDWERLPSIPDKEGFAGSFAGVHDNVLILCGGANFPGAKPWEGGTKIWHDDVFVLDKPNDAWRRVGALPRPLGYGVSISTKGGILCIGGSNSDGHVADCLLLSFRNGKVATESIPSLPQPIANLCGARLGDTIYVAGGTDSPTATKALRSFYSLDLANVDDGWHELEGWPGPERMLATAGSLDDSLYLIGGVALKEGADGKPVRQWLRDAYRYSMPDGWSRVADLPRPAVAAPSPAIAGGSAHLFLFGGDDGSQLDALPGAHRGFPKDVLCYDANNNTWTKMGVLPFSLVTATTVLWNGRIVIPGGETKPGIRSTEVWSGRWMNR